MALVAGAIWLPFASAVVASVGDGRPAASMNDLRDHFARCVHLPESPSGSRPTFYFSLTSRGTIVARPRIVVFDFKGSVDERKRVTEAAGKALSACLPLALTDEMASTIPGKVYFLQFAVGPKDKITSVLFRPFGSHGGVPDQLLPSEPLGEGFIPSSPATVFRSPPPRRQVFAPRPFRPPLLFLRPRFQRPPAARR